MIIFAYVHQSSLHLISLFYWSLTRYTFQGMSSAQQENCTVLYRMVRLCQKRCVSWLKACLRSTKISIMIMIYPIHVLTAGRHSITVTIKWWNFLLIIYLLTESFFVIKLCDNQITTYIINPLNGKNIYHLFDPWISYIEMLTTTFNLAKLLFCPSFWVILKIERRQNLTILCLFTITKAAKYKKLLLN